MIILCVVLEKLGHWAYRSTLFLPRGKLSWDFSPTYSMLSIREDLWCLPAQVIISVFPCMARLCWTGQSSNSRQKPFLWGTPAGHVNQSLPSEWNLRLESLFLIIWTGTLARGYSNSPYWLQWVWFLILPWCWSLSVHFWISHKGNFFPWIIAELVCFWGKEGSGLPTVPFTGVTLLFSSCFVSWETCVP